MADTIIPQLLSAQQLAQLTQNVQRSSRANATTALHWYQQDVPALLGHVAALDQAARYIPVSEALPTRFNELGWSDAMQVCTDGRVNIFPHNYIRGTKGKPGYWIQVGEPHHVLNVTHWRPFPADPAPVEVVVAGNGPASDKQPWTLVTEAFPPSLPAQRIERSAVVDIRKERGPAGQAYYMPSIGGGWRNADTHTPVEGIVVSWRAR